MPTNRLIRDDPDKPKPSADAINAKFATTGTGLRWRDGNLAPIPLVDFEYERHGATHYEPGGNPAFSPAQRQLERFLIDLTDDKLNQSHVDAVPERWRRIAWNKALLNFDEGQGGRYVLPKPRQHTPAA